MGYSKDQLLDRLKELEIDFARYDHPVVLTVEAQEKYIGHLKGGISKNLFLKDKKHRFYVVSALSGTTVDLKVLSQRLGLGKGGLRMAPEEALREILQVPLGCVTPFALINDTARNVALLLDQGFKAQECCFFHPLSNDVTISLKDHDLDKFLNSIGKDPSYVNLEADVAVGKDQPPDLAALVPSAALALPDPPESALSSKATSENHVVVINKSDVTTGKVVKQSTKQAQSVKEKPLASQQPPPSCMNIDYFVDQIISKTSSLVLSGITSETIEQHGEKLGGVVSDNIKKKLSADLASLAMMLKNTAYSEGFKTGTQTR
ncbi:Prolyl-trna synthetase associated domain-containing protein [Thalictrum thalictroides]|uniref:Prolyl-trna synthetase associated domain-containing protein n=1 Tax=Thalictrum thalictroides TaxID=46969 RepID=A0A7J6WVG9_THATH|nr:Prolyl-trna synthetase associated domain-containing protein [Thalictrum thalictroides]